MNQEPSYTIPVFILCILLISGIFMMPHSFAVSNLDVQIPRDKYVFNDSVYVSGTLFAATSDTLTLKIYDDEAKLVLTHKIPIGADDTSFSHTLVLSSSTWTNSGLYVILAEIDNVIASTKFTFDSKQDSMSIRNQTSTPTESELIGTIDTSQLAQQIADHLASQISSSQPQLDTSQLAQQIASQISSSQPQLDTSQLAQQIASQISSSQQPIDTSQLAQQIASQISSSQPQLDTSQLAQQIASQISSSQPQLDTSQLAQQIASQISSSQQPIDAAQLAQQIADKIAISQLNVEQSSSQQPIDTSQLAQQKIQQIITKKLMIQQKIDELTVQQVKAQQEIDDLILLKASVNSTHLQLDPTPLQIENQNRLDRLLLQLRIQEQLIDNLKSDELEAEQLNAYAIEQQIAAKRLSEEQTLKELQSDILYTKKLLTSLDTTMSESLTSQLIAAQQIADDLSAQKINAQQIADNLDLELIAAQQVTEQKPVPDAPVADNTLLIIITIILSIILGLVLYLKLPTHAKHSLPSQLPITQSSSLDSTLIVIREPAAASVKLTNNTELSYEKWKNMDMQQKPKIDLLNFWVPIVNTGNTSITNVSMGFIQDTHEFTNQDLNRINTIPLPDLSAGNYYYHSFSISWKQITQLNNTPIFVGIHICYDADNNRYENRQSYQVIYKIDNDKISLL